MSLLKTTVLIIMLIIAILIAFIGLIIKYKKAYWLVSGYNTMTEEERANVDTEKMGNAVSTMLFIMGGLVAAGGFLFNFNMDIAGIISMMMILPISLVGIVTSHRYDHNESKTESIFMAVGLGFFFTLIVIVVFVSLYSGSRPNTYTVSDGMLNISGMYGKSISLSDVKSVELKDNLPGRLFKASGYNLGTILKGRFHSDSGNAALYVDTSNPPFIYIITSDNELTILNESKGEETKQLYESLKSYITNQ